ncbi:hypothetical protein RF11_08919 [Thelohanellus kitauei]|uniref:Uncharacterized protein n=1 Tax=Thelohanellus kitauei TaxID=669202 RepID=A0A0C2IKZ7_THEKT|nr:hypothetical protein RF11_08919 [Thelohanellus kitauei]
MESQDDNITVEQSGIRPRSQTHLDHSPEVHAADELDAWCDVSGVIGWTSRCTTSADSQTLDQESDNFMGTLKEATVIQEVVGDGRRNAVLLKRSSCHTFLKLTRSWQLAAFSHYRKIRVDAVKPKDNGKDDGKNCRGERVFVKDVYRALITTMSDTQSAKDDANTDDPFEVCADV